jgi:hypothetical protein
MECVIVRQAGRAVTVRQILMNVLMLLSVRTTLNVRILMDLTSVCVMMDTSDLDWSRRGHDRMVVGFTTACAISAYHH